ncbi:MAG: energy transducer TonB, partial [Bacteroidota bacterium]
AGGERRYDVTPMPDEFTPEEEEIIEEPEEEEPEEEEPEEEPPPPELQEEIQEVSLAQLEGILNSGGGIGVGPAEFSVKGLAQAAGADIANLEMNSFGDRPRPRSQPQPDLTGPERKATPGRATVRFAVDVNGRVQDVSLHEATHPLLGRAAVRTIKKWRFYPAMRDGKPVRKAVSQTIEFQKQ